MRALMGKGGMKSQRSQMVYRFIDNSFLFTKQPLSQMRALMGKGGMKSQRSQIPYNVSFRTSQNSGLESQKSQNVTDGTQESQTFPSSLSQRSQRVNLVSSKSH